MRFPGLLRRPNAEVSKLIFLLEFGVRIWELGEFRDGVRMLKLLSRSLEFGVWELGVAGLRRFGVSEFGAWSSGIDCLVLSWKSGVKHEAPTGPELAGRESWTADVKNETPTPCFPEPAGKLPVRRLLAQLKPERLGCKTVRRREARCQVANLLESAERLACTVRLFSLSAWGLGPSAALSSTKGPHHL